MELDSYGFQDYKSILAEKRLLIKSSCINDELMKKANINAGDI